MDEQEAMQKALEASLPPSTPGREYVFPSAYGGAVRSTVPPQIHAMMRKLRIEVGAIEAKKAAGGPMFPVRGAKDLNQKLANALNALDMEAPVVRQDITFFDADKIPDNKNARGTAPVFRTLAHVKATVRLIAPDTSFIDVVGSGHGGDVDDKSGGKASTYAWKDAILKGLSIPHEDMVDTDDDSSTGGGQAGNSGESGGKAAGKGSGRKGAKAKEGAGAQDSGGESAVGLGTVDSPTRDGSATSSEPGQEGLAGVMASIEKANTVADLELIRTAIKSGDIKLHGADKLKATQAWVARKEKLAKESS